MKQNRKATFEPKASNSCLGAGAVVSQLSSMLTTAPAAQNSKATKKNGLASFALQSNGKLTDDEQRANDRRTGTCG
jgi:hypothetical protein